MGTEKVRWRSVKQEDIQIHDFFFLYIYFFSHDSTPLTQKMCLLGAVGEQEEPSGASGQLETPFSKWCFALGRLSVTNYGFF